MVTTIDRGIDAIGRVWQRAMRRSACCDDDEAEGVPHVGVRTYATGRQSQGYWIGGGSAQNALMFMVATSWSGSQ